MKAILKKEAPPCGLCETKKDSIFCHLNHAELEILTKHKTHILFKKGQALFYENSQVQGIYCIYSGKILIHKNMDAREQVVRLVRPGDWIGDRALLNDESYSTSATAVEVTEVCYIPRQVFTGLLKENSDLALEAMKFLSGKLKTAEHLLTSMVHKQSDEKMAEALLALGEYYGYEDDKMTIRANFSRENLAGIAGITTETAIRLLSSFNKSKLVRLIGKRIKLTDIPKLQALSNK